MWVLHRGSIPYSKVVQVCALTSEQDLGILETVLEGAIEIFKDDPRSLPFIRDQIDVRSIKKFLTEILKGYHPFYNILVFYTKDTKDNEENCLVLSGASLVSRGTPWYASDRTQVLCEECTVCFTPDKGIGLYRALAYILENFPNPLGYESNLVMFSNANAPYAKSIENTFTKKLTGYQTYTTFFKYIKDYNNG